MRRVELPPGVPGKLYLHHLPGHGESLTKFCHAISTLEISLVACLVPDREVMMTNPGYSKAMANKLLPCQVQVYPITGFGVPVDRGSFVRFTGALACRLRSGENLLIHCLSGCGRSGLVAICLLIELGILAAEAAVLVDLAGSHLESPSQEAFIDWFAQYRFVVGL